LFVETATDPVKAALADGIARCRRRCWELEHDLFGFQVPVGPFAPKSKGAVSNPDALLELRDLKTLLGIMVLARLHVVGHVPPGAGSWADKWERHRWKLADKPGAGATPRDAWAAHDRGIRTPRRGVTPAPIIAAATRQNIFVASPERKNAAGGFDETWLLDGSGRRSIPSRLLAAYGGPAVVKTIPRELLYSLPQGPDLT
jgi:hypothetical protein